MVDVFISYKREERSRCERIYRKLTAMELDVWFDAHLTAGERFRREITQTVNAARAVLVLWSPASVESDWVLDEAGVGQRRKVLVAARLAPCDLPIGFGQVHYEDLHEENFSDDHVGWLKILDRIGSLSGRSGLASYSAAIATASAGLLQWAESNGADRLAGRMRTLAKGLMLAEGSEMLADPSFRVNSPVRLTGPGPRWAQIEHSLVAADYSDFLAVFPTADQAFEARRHKRLLDEWASLDRDDASALDALLEKRPFPALDRLARAAVTRQFLTRDRRERWALMPGPVVAMWASPPEWVSDFGQDRFGAFTRFTIDGVIQTLRWIPPGRFQMGSPGDEPGRFDDEGPAHVVTIAAGFWLFDTPCTQALWQAAMGDNPSWFKSPDRPIEMVSWNDCKGFIDWINARIPGLDLSLPTDAQWEYACRAESGTAIYTGSLRILGDNNGPALDPVAWYGGNSGVDFDLPDGHDSQNWPGKQYLHVKAGTRPVGRKAPNAWGLFDMLGNVWEWCDDAPRPYVGLPLVDPVGPTEPGEARVLRGGSWFNGAAHCRSACRIQCDPDARSGSIGFRCARAQA